MEELNYIKNTSTFRIHLCVILTLVLVFWGNSLNAQLNEVSDQDLSLISAQAGISYNWGDSRLRVTYDSFQVSDTDHDPKNWIEFNDITIAGPDGYFSLDENCQDPTLFQFNTIDLATMTTIDNKTRTFINFKDSTNTNPRTWSIGQLVFCSQDIGGIQFDVRNIDSTSLKVSTHGAGASGIEFEYLSNWLIENFSYTYNSSGDSLTISGIHVSETAIGLADNPTDPSTWEFAGRFQIGDLYGGVIDFDNDPGNAALSNPASMDVATTTDGVTSVYLNLPMKGTIRAEDVEFGGNSFGPMAVDGITAHHLLIRFNPGN